MNNSNAIFPLYTPLILWIFMAIRFAFFFPWFFSALFTLFFTLVWPYWSHWTVLGPFTLILIFSAINLSKAFGLRWLNYWYYTELNCACGIFLSIGVLVF